MTEKNKKYHRVERAYGSFGRSFSFPDDASPGKVSADFKDGVLAVHLAKVAKAKSLMLFEATPLAPGNDV